jgi:hypothetical protein
MEESESLMAILVIGFAIGLAIMPIFMNIKFRWQRAREYVRYNIEFNKKLESVAKMKANGDFHEWVIISDISGPKTVCRKTGYCSELDAFVPMDLLKSYLEKIKIEEEYKVFRDEKVSELAKEIGLDIPKTEIIVEKIFSMKKDFSLLKLDQLQGELEKRAEDVGKQQN